MLDADAGFRAVEAGRGKFKLNIILPKMKSRKLLSHFLVLEIA